MLAWNVAAAAGAAGIVKAIGGAVAVAPTTPTYDPTTGVANNVVAYVLATVVTKVSIGLWGTIPIVGLDLIAAFGLAGGGRYVAALPHTAAEKLVGSKGIIQSLLSL